MQQNNKNSDVVFNMCDIFDGKGKSNCETACHYCK